MFNQSISALLILLLAGSAADAATFCATNGTTLKAALASADSNGQADVIRLASGFYAYPGAGTFSYSPPTSENFDIEISGGWTSFFGNPCGQLLENTDAFDTVITSDAPTRLMNIEPPANSTRNVTVRRITFLGGDAGAGEGGGLRIYPFIGYSGTILVDQCAFLTNQAATGAGLRILSSAVVYLRNSLFDDNNAISNSAVALEAIAGPGIYVTNTTIVNNTTDSIGTSTFAGLSIRTSGGAQAFVANNNIWSNEGSDLRLLAGSMILRNNNLESVASPAGGITESTGNISEVPVYEIGSLNYTPAPGSPLINAGTQPPGIVPIPVPFDDNWGTGALDIYSNPRKNGPKIDIGAYEADTNLIFANGFEPVPASVQ